MKRYEMKRIRFMNFLNKGGGIRFDGEAIFWDIWLGLVEEIVKSGKFFRELIFPLKN